MAVIPALPKPPIGPLGRLQSIEAALASLRISLCDGGFSRAEWAIVDMNVRTVIMSHFKEHGRRQEHGRTGT